MKQTAYGRPIIVKDDEVTLLSQVEAINEASIQDLVFNPNNAVELL